MTINTQASLDEINYNSYTVQEVIEFLKSKNDPKLYFLIVWLIRGIYFHESVETIRISLADKERSCIDECREIPGPYKGI